MSRTTASALASDDAKLVQVALYVARELKVAIDQTRLTELKRHEDRAVAKAAQELLESRAAAQTAEAPALST